MAEVYPYEINESIIEINENDTGRQDNLYGSMSSLRLNAWGTVTSRTSITGGVIPAGADRIRVDFRFEGVRYRPTLLRTPSESNLRWARQHLEGIKRRIASGTFSFAEEFPDFRHLRKVPDQGSPKACAQVFDAFLAHCASRVTRHDMAPKR